MKNILLITFSDNADHQDISFSMFESIYKCDNSECNIWIMAINNPKVPVMSTSQTYLVDCPKKPGIEKKTFDVRELYRIIKWIKSHRFDVIFIESLHLWNIVIMIFCSKRTLIMQMIHDVIPHRGDKQEKNVYLMNKIVCKLADYIVLCNQKYVPKLAEIYGVPEQRIRFVDMWRRFPKYTEPHYSKQVLFFGRINPYKGVDNLLEIARNCHEIQFNIVGRVDSQVQELAYELSKLPNVAMSNGYVTDKEMAEAFIKADWVILPYNSATQSGVVIDAYRYSRPCIAFNVGAIDEQICDGFSGYLISKGNNLAFSEKLRQAINMNKEEYRKMSLNAYKYGLKKYSSDGAIDRFKKVIS